ncbi:PAS domain S-box protein [Pedobacter duraquae]|uniref:PAS domain S-box-containing protein n=1 Tax=Pedobacter duraquae TaxID=425511 RepID=A0A4R6IFA1_9SPHI|nr:PAS domain S-box protein [Pedobacter duraquae]TDO20317.1 PAS domain S-box-containing protein [Pedobacter duraquae]
MNELSDLEMFYACSPDLLCIAGFDGYFKRVNPAVSKVLGYSEQELLSRPIDSFVHPEDKAMTGKSRRNVISGTALINFDNRYMTKSGEIVWLTWSSVRIEAKQLIFGVAKDITLRKKLEEYRRISHILNEQEQCDPESEYKREIQDAGNISKIDQTWLVKLESVVRKNIGQFDITISLLSNEMAISERQLFRRLKNIVALTPNQYMRIIRLQVAMEGLKNGTFHTVKEVSLDCGFKTPAYFHKLFKGIYGAEVFEFIKKSKAA